MRDGDEAGMAILVAAVLAILFALIIGLVQALLTHAWLWVFVLAAGGIYYLYRREKRRERLGNMPGKPPHDCGCPKKK